MSTIPTGPSLSQALVYGWGMLVFYGVLMGWIVVFGMQVSRPRSRHVTAKISLTLSLLMGMLALLQYFYWMLDLNSPIYVSGSIDPLLYYFRLDVIILSALIIGSCGAVTLILSAWAWLLPGSPEHPQPDCR